MNPSLAPLRLIAFFTLALGGTVPALPGLCFQEEGPHKEPESSPPKPQENSKPSHQNPSESPNKGPKESAPNKHVRMLLAKMLAQDSFLLRAKYFVKSPLAQLANLIPGQVRGKIKKKKEINILQRHVQAWDSWSLQGKHPDLFRKGTLWAFPLEGEYALAGSRKFSEKWNSKALPDGTILTKVLKALLPQSTWESLGSETFDDRPVLVWRCRLKGKPARLFQAAGMAQDSGSSTMGIMLLMNFPGMQKEKIDIHVEITLYEDPGHKLPRRILIRTFLPRKPLKGQGRIIIQAGGKAQQVDEEEQEKPLKPGETKTHKLANSLELLFSHWGRVKTKPIPQEVEKLLR